MQSGRADLIPNLGIIEQRKAFCTFTALVETFPVSIFVRKHSKDIEGLADLMGRQVAVVRLNVAVYLLQEREGIGLQIFDDVSQALFALLSGQVDALVYPEPVLLKMARDSGITDRIKIVGEPLIEIKRAIAVGKGNPELLARLDRAVGRFVGSSEYKQIYIKWYGKPQPFLTVSRVFLVMSGLLLLIFAAMGLWRYRSVVSLNLQLVENIAGHKKVQEALKTSEERYRTMFESMNNAIAVYEVRDDEGDFIIRDMNRAAEKIEKVKREEVIGKSLLQVFRGAEDFGIVEVFKRVYKTGQPELHPASLYRDYRITGWRENKVYKLPSGEIVAIYEDVTEQKLTENAFRESKKRYHTLARISPVGIFYTNAEGRCLDVNERWCELAGLTPQEAYGEGWTRAIHPDDRERVFTEWERAAKANLPFKSGYRFQRPDGLVTLVFGQAVAEEEDSGKVYKIHWNDYRHYRA